jgi:uncharacterized short protein YbdD (DUF466 family)
MLARVIQIVRTIIGVPDYDRYLRHMARAHPECPPVSREAFMRERQDARYSRPGSRCC